MSGWAVTSLALLCAVALWSGCASAPPAEPSQLPSPAVESQSVEHVRRLLDSGIQYQAGGLYARSQQSLSNALSELSVLDTSGVSPDVRGLTQQVLGAMRNNLPYSLEPDNVDDAVGEEEDGVAMLDSLIPDTATLEPLDSATAAAMRREAMLDSALTFDLPVEINDLVLLHLRIFKDRVPQHFARWLERKGRWEDMIQQELASHGMPKDLLYLSMIESGFNPRATSPAAAAGMWQFIPATGRRFGLRIDRFVDERRDPWKSTRAAIGYLSALYQEFGDWRLAMAAYNCGENCVERAIRRSGTNDYWKVALPHETRNYVPRIFAAAILSKNPKAHGFDIHPWAPVLSDTFSVEGGITLSQISGAMGVPSDSLALLNPALVRGSTPPEHGQWVLNLPVGTRDKFATAYASLERNYQAPQPLRYVHRVRGKETLAGIAARYGVSVADIKKWNRIGGRTRKVRPGRTLVIWGDFPGQSAVAGLVEPPLAKRGQGIPQHTQQASHKVRRGESLAAIARQYGVSTNDLCQWNGISGGKIKPGHRIWVSAPAQIEQGTIDGLPHVAQDSDQQSEATVAETKAEPAAKPSTHDDGAFRHRVHRGETLSAIARRYGVTVAQIRDWNGLGSDRVKPGSRLWIGEAASDKSSERVAEKNGTSRAKTADARDVSRVYVVRRGETLDMIAHQYGVATSSIRILNHLKTSRIKAGQKIVVPGMAPAVSTSAPVARIASASRLHTVSYTVRSGDSLYSIARARATTVDTLMHINGLKRASIKPGQVIQVPLASAQ